MPAAIFFSLGLIWQQNYKQFCDENFSDSGHSIEYNIIGKIAITKSRYLKHFYSKAKLKQNVNYDGN